MSTTHVRSATLKERWLLYDASQFTLGQLAAQIAMNLMGKDQPTYTASELNGAFVIVVNADQVKTTGRKSEQKSYDFFSGSGRSEDRRLRGPQAPPSGRRAPSRGQAHAAEVDPRPRHASAPEDLRRPGSSAHRSATRPSPEDPLMTTAQLTWGLGRRKSAVARVRLTPGAGGFVVNGRDAKEFFRTVQTQMRLLAPLKATGTEGAYDVFCTVDGGGPTGQSDAIVLGIARALKKINPGHDDVLRANGLLTRDSRMKERKKYGRRGARRGVQFSKR